MSEPAFMSDGGAELTLQVGGSFLLEFPDGEVKRYRVTAMHMHPGPPNTGPSWSTASPMVGNVRIALEPL